MTDSTLDNSESHESLKNLIQEYRERDRMHNVPLYEKVGVGAAWFDASTRKMYVCNGKVDGKLIWTCVN